MAITPCIIIPLWEQFFISMGMPHVDASSAAPRSRAEKGETDPACAAVARERHKKRQGLVPALPCVFKISTFIYFVNLLLAKATPVRPRPRSSIVVGSGTASGTQSSNVTVRADPR